ncbi:heparinase II/III family protein [Sporomusa acidovorans]|uniref:Heparin-sulfate lyase n=1 Tax=Sporomusa acidovorans (strain ATCC 49682 / DSM 3132 / Mol) TaxID=1123286 RepID=A0ABZ3J791_SPOA4|nr:heparinase II/III family protein [Sporomusa acidovorans]OZC19345.1 heparin-sulfate lyase precursor [Sporomusa acidovorans DSM 3132]SDD80077.1 Heparinase II/III-like protein [Sporomusa acidovorans]
MRFSKDLFGPTYSNKKIKLEFSCIGSLIHLPYTPDNVEYISNLYVTHYFDLLGSGWVQVKKGMDCLGLEGYRYEDLTVNGYEGNMINRANRRESEAIRILIDKKYIPIDWQLDFKSGYRWSEKTWYMEIKYGHKPGVDIKVPWELARMQHLPILAWTYGFIAEDKEKYAREFRNQILDFVVENPPRFGVNWRCTMDVGIRVANWLVTYDLFKAFGTEFDDEFEAVFARSVYEHGRHCYENLEYHPKYRNNHYLSDIAGLLFAASHLESNSETDVWLSFAVQELISEMDFEFNPDGSNFEASTNYHRLSTEIMLYCAILCLTLPAEKKRALMNYDFKLHRVKPNLKRPCEQEYNINTTQLLPDWFWELLERACEFTLHMLKPSGDAPQIGDNDSGRFFKIWPSYLKRTVAETINIYENLEGYSELPLDAEYWDENVLDHRHILGVAGVLFNRQDFLAYVEPDNPEVALIKAWLKGKTISSYRQKEQLRRPRAQGRKINNLSSGDICDWLAMLNKEFGKPVTYEFTSNNKEKELTDGLAIYSYPDFGLYIYQSPLLYLAVRCGSIGQNGLGGHAHNDQLSIELTIDGGDIISDPGTYLYTPLPAKRNKFRSTGVHFTPLDKDKEQNDWIAGQRGLFQLFNKAKAETKYLGIDGFVGMHSGFGKPVYRVIKLQGNHVYCYDFNVNEKIQIGKKSFSRGYGKCEEKRC